VSDNLVTEHSRLQYVPVTCGECSVVKDAHDTRSYPGHVGHKLTRSIATHSVYGARHCRQLKQACGYG